MRLRGAYVARRVSYALIALLAVLVLNFIIPRAVPGNPVQIFANPRILPSLETKILTARFGLDQPIWMQFLSLPERNFSMAAGLWSLFQVLSDAGLERNSCLPAVDFVSRRPFDGGDCRFWA